MSCFKSDRERRGFFFFQSHKRPGSVRLPRTRMSVYALDDVLGGGASIISSKAGGAKIARSVQRVRHGARLTPGKEARIRAALTKGGLDNQVIDVKAHWDSSLTDRENKEILERAVDPTWKEAHYAGNLRVKEKTKEGYVKDQAASFRDGSVKYLNGEDFNKLLVSRNMPAAVGAKGAYFYDGIKYVNCDNIQGKEDLRRTILHELGHERYGPDEEVAEAFALNELFRRNYKPDAKKHEALIDSEYRYFFPCTSAYSNPSLGEKERVLKSRVKEVLARVPGGSGSVRGIRDFWKKEPVPAVELIPDVARPGEFDVVRMRPGGLIDVKHLSSLEARKLKA